MAWAGQNIPHFLSPLSPMNYLGRRCLGLGGVGGMKLFPIDCLIAPEAACPRLWPREDFLFVCFFPPCIQ